MTKQEEQFEKFYQAEPNMTDNEYETKIRQLAKSLDIKKAMVEKLMAVRETSYYNSQEFEKHLKSYQNSLKR